MTTRVGWHVGKRGRTGVFELVVACAVVASALVLAPHVARAVTLPVANPDVVEVGPGSSLDIDVLANDSDDGGIENVKVTRIVTPPAVGSAIVVDDIGVNYTSPDPFSGVTFTYEIDDGVDGTAIGEVTVNPPPPLCPDIDLPAGSGGQAFRDAILGANTCVGPQVITLGAGTYDRALPQISDSLTIRAADANARPVLIDTTQQPSSINPVVSMSNAGVVVLENLVIRDAGYYPSLVSAGNTTLTVTGSSLEGSSLPESVTGAGVQGYRGSDVVVRDTVIHQADGFGVQVDTGSLVLDRVSVSSSSITGVQVTNATSLTITASDIFDNSVDSSASSGVYVRATEPVSITDTSIWGHPGYGIDAIGPYTLTRGRIGETPQGVPAGNFNGVLAWPTTDAVVIDGTLIAHNQQWGILKQVSGPLTLTDVTVRDNTGSGLETYGGVTTATNSVFRDNGPDCVIGSGTVVDGGGSTDSDDTCFPDANHAPVAVSERVSVDEDDTLVAPPGTVLANDTDVDGDSLTAVLEDDVSHGTLTLQSDGGFTYLPFADYFGSDAFTYRANDGSLVSEPATVHLTITGYNDAPTIDVPPSVQATLDQPIDIVVSVGDVDADDRPPFVADDIVPLVGLAVDHGTITVVDAADATTFDNSSATVAIEGELAAINAALATVTYTPSSGYVGPDTLTVVVRDNGENGIGTGLITEHTVPISVRFPALPTVTIEPASLTFDEDTTGSVTVSINDPDGDPSDIVITAALVDDTLATADVTGTGATRTVTVTGAADATGSTILQIGYSDGVQTALEFVPVTITPVNDAPTIDAIADVVTLQDTPTVAAIMIADVDNAELVVTATTDPEGVATVAPTSSNEVLDIIPVPGAFATTIVEVTVSDGALSASSSFELTVTELNLAPIGAADEYGTDEDIPLLVVDPALGVLANDSDPNGDTIFAGSFTEPISGALTGNPDGTFSYTPEPGHVRVRHLHLCRLGRIPGRSGNHGDHHDRTHRRRPSGCPTVTRPTRASRSSWTCSPTTPMSMATVC